MARAITLALLGAVLHSSPAPAQARRQPKRPEPPEMRREQAPQRLLSDSALAQLKYRYIGPVGNRVSAVAGVAGDPSTYYVGAASGGIWKTTDGGVHWQPIFDDQPVQSLGALAVALSDPNVVWAGTGEAWIRSHISIGNGVYKSTDAGKTWQHVGLPGLPGVGGLVDAVADRDVTADPCLARAGPDDVGIGERDREGAERLHRLIVEDRLPVHAAVRRLPDPARRGADVVRARVAG